MMPVYKKPQIEVFIAHADNAEQIKKALAEGMEEEGVPYHFCAQNEPLNAVDLARLAAQESPLQVGVGVDKQGSIAIHHQKLPDDRPLFLVHLPYPNTQMRKLGNHAARLVKGLPFDLTE
ncbi:glycerol dehydratase reactivase beta/small subunit family protein [Neisseria sp. Ec49-e6-T10]|uniref:glycerol dehydratase reactivase beta/small subunit family protein n=1 Tax=Neisseria sp. Ec49-e6-T10 TaxID=3140744 RepID=UPI003EB9B6C8